MKSSAPLRPVLAAGLFLLFPALSAHAGEVVKWPNLKKLDDLAEKCEALCDRKDIAGLRKIAAATKAAAVAVESDALPAGAKDKEKLKTLQADLKSLTDELGDPKTGDADELMGLLAGVHPIVEQLMEAAGMPHVHEEEPKKK